MSPPAPKPVLEEPQWQQALKKKQQPAPKQAKPAPKPKPAWWPPEVVQHHDVAPSSAPIKGTHYVRGKKVCWYFGRGRCRNGDACKYLHIREDEEKEEDPAPKPPEPEPEPEPEPKSKGKAKAKAGRARARARARARLHRQLRHLLRWTQGQPVHALQAPVRLLQVLRGREAFPGVPHLPRADRGHFQSVCVGEQNHVLWSLRHACCQKT